MSGWRDRRKTRIELFLPLLCKKTNKTHPSTCHLSRVVEAGWKARNCLRTACEGDFFPITTKLFDALRVTDAFFGCVIFSLLFSRFDPSPSGELINKNEAGAHNNKKKDVLCSMQPGPTCESRHGFEVIPPEGLPTPPVPQKAARRTFLRPLPPRPLEFSSRGPSNHGCSQNSQQAVFR